MLLTVYLLSFAIAVIPSWIFGESLALIWTYFFRSVYLAYELNFHYICKMCHFLSVISVLKFLFTFSMHC